MAHSLNGLHVGAPVVGPALNITTSGECIKMLVTGPVDVPACAYPKNAADAIEAIIAQYFFIVSWMC